MIRISTALVSLLAIVPACACGGVDDDELPFQDDSVLEEELGTVEQAYNAPVTPSSQLGTQTGASRQRCNRTSSGQVCSVPGFPYAVKWCIDSSLSANARSRISARISSLDSNLSIWSFAENLDILGSCDQATAHMVVAKSAVGSAGTGSNDIKDYATVNFSGVTQLTENGIPGEPAVVGQYQKHTKCDIRVDETDILAKGTSSTQDNNGLDHGSAHAIEGCLGIGGRPITAAAASRNVVNFSQVATSLTSGEACALNAFNNVNNGNFANAGSCSSD